MPVTELPIRGPADRGRRAPQRPHALLSTPPHREPAEVALAIDRWNNEGGFVGEPAPGGRTRERRPSWQC